MITKKDYKDITVGEIADNNSDVLKTLFNKKPVSKTTQDLIDSLDTEIKRPRFE